MKEMYNYFLIFDLSVPPISYKSLKHLYGAERKKNVLNSYLQELGPVLFAHTGNLKYK